jgi:2'-5' RNA ligase
LEIYEQLWQQAVTAFERGCPQLDSHLLDKAKDFRRSVTLALRPSIAVQEKVNRFLGQLNALAPEQYFYSPAEFHVTALSVISGTEWWRKEMRALAACRAIIAKVLARQKSLAIQFRGVTASPGAVMIQGFPVNDALNILRDELREALAQNSLAGQLDRRYKNCTAHITILRFQQAQSDWKKLLTFLAEHRRTDFGEMTVNRLELVWSDWYASAATARILQEYHLSTKADSIES